MTTLVLFRKEVTEHWRTYKSLSVAAVLLVFGLASPLLLAYLPELIEFSGDDQIVFEIPEFTAADAVINYVETLGQVGLITIILISMGAIAEERERGTIELLLSKPVGAGPFVIAKLMGLTTVLTAGLVAGAAGCYGYTVVLVGNPDALSFVASMLLAGPYLLVVMSVTLFFGAMVKNQIIAGVLALTLLISGAFLSSLPALGPYLPGSLMRWATDLHTGGARTASWGHWQSA
ncbi:MAG: ABC transporter permease [Chloroflexi bacterium]|nr:ABC transporter permease [Chloroflexota bacterium]